MINFESLKKKKDTGKKEQITISEFSKSFFALARNGSALQSPDEVILTFYCTGGQSEPVGILAFRSS